MVKDENSNIMDSTVTVDNGLLGRPELLEWIIEQELLNETNDERAVERLVHMLREDNYSLAEASTYVAEFVSRVYEQSQETADRATPEGAQRYLEMYYSKEDQRLIDQVAEKEADNRNVYSLSQLRQLDLPSAKPVVDGLIREGETGLIVGRPKIGKSRLAMQLALSISRGEHFLGFKVVGEHRVLILDLENQPVVVKERFEKMSVSDDSDDRVFIYAPSTLAESNVGLAGDGLKRLKEIVSDFEPTLLIVDTWRLLIGPVDENKSEKVLEGLKALSGLRIQRRHMVIIIVHHLRKQNFEGSTKLRDDPNGWVEAVSGHHALVGHVDWCYGLERERDVNDEELVIFGGVARNAASNLILLSDDEDTLRYEVVDGEAALTKVLTGIEMDFWKVAKEKGRFTFTELVRAVETKNKKAVSSLLRKAEKHGLLEKTGDSKKSVYVVKGM